MDDDHAKSEFVAELLRMLPKDAEERSNKIERRIDRFKERVVSAVSGSAPFGGHFNNYLARECKRNPDLLDKLLAWFPEDGLQVEYSRRGDGTDFQSIHLIYDLVVRQIRENKLRRQIIVVTHNPNIVVNGDAEMLHALDFVRGQCVVQQSGSLQEEDMREEVCRVMEGGREAFKRRYRSIQLGESTFLELKEVRFAGGKVRGPHREDLADEIAAFANARGGVCLLGVTGEREVVGVPVNRTTAVVALAREICTDSLEPPLNAVIDSVWLPAETGEELAVVRIDVPRSLFVHRSPGGYLHRVGDAKRPMSPDCLSRLFQQRSQTRLIRFDEQIVPGARVDDLSPALWERFRTSRTGAAPERLLSNLRMAREDDDGALRPTVAGVLLTSADPRPWLPNAFVQAVAYRGTRIRPDLSGDPYQLDAADLTGPLDVQVEQACRFVARNMKVAAFKHLGRVDRPQFDMEAVFEAVVNAVAHRDYSIYGSKIRLRLFDDRLEL